MSGKQAFVTLLILIVVIYVGLYGITYNIFNKTPLHHYVMFIVNIIPSLAVLLGLLTRLLMSRSKPFKKFLLSSLICTLTTIISTIIYALNYNSVTMLYDIYGFIYYCLIVNVFLFLCNFAISIMGINNYQ
jgi:4-amino-4-deoxy-L-arabinose transferase-like glycosyltransferase